MMDLCVYLKYEKIPLERRRGEVRRNWDRNVTRDARSKYKHEIKPRRKGRMSYRWFNSVLDHLLNFRPYVIWRLICNPLPAARYPSPRSLALHSSISSLILIRYKIIHLWSRCDCRCLLDFAPLSLQHLQIRTDRTKEKKLNRQPSPFSFLSSLFSLSSCRECYNKN